MMDTEFAAHLDPVNMISSPMRFFGSGDFLRECFAKLGPYIKTCHGKDVALAGRLTVHLDEVRPGLGGLDYHTFLTELDKLPADTALVLEHLSSEEDYAQAARHVRAIASELGIRLWGTAESGRLKPRQQNHKTCLRRLRGPNKIPVLG